MGTASVLLPWADLTITAVMKFGTKGCLRAPKKSHEDGGLVPTRLLCPTERLAPGSPCKGTGVGFQGVKGGETSRDGAALPGGDADAGGGRLGRGGPHFPYPRGGCHRAWQPGRAESTVISLYYESSFICELFLWHQQ